MLEQMIDDNEKVLWTGKPDFWVYVIGNPVFYLFALIWGIFDFMFIKQFTAVAHGPGASFFGNFPIFFFALHLTPVWIAIFSPIYRAFNHRTIEYAVTDRRSYLVSGLFGRDVTVVEHRFVQELTVNVGFIENLRGVGTLKLTPDVTTTSGRNSRTISGCAIRAIENPYEVYKMLKKISLDVTTDQMFPNAYRPDENPGYNTTLDE